uniref:WAPL domain-containing protein n=1 Tax=Ciona savignyi TaxID=51511 RepID=H2Z9V2_CIOSA
MKMSVPSLESKSESKSVVEALVQLFVDREVAARSNEVLGEEGVKKAVNRAKESDIPDKSSDSESVSGSQSSVDDRLKNVEGGHWVESEDGMEWIPSTTEEEESLPLSQRSSSSGMRNPEASLSVEQKAEMKQMLDKANEHMEHSVVAAYAGLVLGCLIHANRANIAVIRSYFGDDASFAPMIRILRKFLSFMNLTAGMSAKGERLLTQIIEDLQEESAALS